MTRGRKPVPSEISYRHARRRPLIRSGRLSLAAVVLVAAHALAEPDSPPAITLTYESRTSSQIVFSLENFSVQTVFVRGARIECMSADALRWEPQAVRLPAENLNVRTVLPGERVLLVAFGPIATFARNHPRAPCVAYLTLSGESVVASKGFHLQPMSPQSNM